MCWTKWYLLETFNKMPSKSKYNVCEIYLTSLKNVKISTDHKNTFCHMYHEFYTQKSLQYFFANLSFPRAFNDLDNSLNVTDSPLSNQTINIWNDFSFTLGYCTWSACISSMLAFGTFNLSPKDFQNLPMSCDKSSRTSSVTALSHSSFTTFDLLVGGASTKENDKLIHDWLHEMATCSGS